MFYKDTDQIRSAINRGGRLGTPFLFGVDYEMKEGFFIDKPMSQNNICFEINGVGNKKKSSSVLPIVDFRSVPISYEEYQNKFDIVHAGLKRGDSFLANLTIRTPIETNLSLESIFASSDAPYQLYIPDRLVCFSPERFVKIANGLISSHPMKGTIDASIANAERIILADFKESAEHSTIVDLIRNDLSMVADQVRVSKYRYIDRVVTDRGAILQVSSEIQGRLPGDYRAHLGDIVFKLLPAGSICGAPKKATVDLIRSAEKEPRGYYTGVFGYFDGKSLDTGVLIRFVEKEGEQLFFRSGGGITAYSKCENEYQEMLNKIYLPPVCASPNL